MSASGPIDGTSGRPNDIAMDQAPRIDRRTALQWIGTATAAIPLLERGLEGAERDGLRGKSDYSAGYGPDPDVLRSYKPGDLWPLTFDNAQRRLMVVLCDIIVPADETSPSASSLGVHDFVDEWISSPYPGQQADRRVILQGLTWIDEEAVRLGSDDFVSMASGERFAVCQDLARKAKVNPKAFPGNFFYRLRNLVAGGYYTTPAGMHDIGYRGNTPEERWDGPPKEVLEQLKLSPQ